MAEVVVGGAGKGEGVRAYRTTFERKAPVIRVIAICRDEEAAIAGFLAQFAPLTNDRCLLDTGSTDGTIAIARAHGARVESAPFVDFATARNEAVDRFGAGADWIVMLDIDERLDADTIANIDGLARDARFDIFLAPTESLYESGARRRFIPKAFLFRRDPSLRWVFRVHEKLVGSLRQAVVRNARIEHGMALHSAARRGEAEARYEALARNEPYFSDPDFKRRIVAEWPILDYDRAGDARLASVVAGPLVSVVIPTFRRRELLQCAVRSALAQDYANLEILVVADHDPGIEGIVGAFADEPRVGVFDLERNHGAGGAEPRNAAIGLAKGDLIAYLDDDNAWAADHVSSVVAAMRRYDAAFAFSSMRADGLDLHFTRPERQGIDTSCVIHRKNLIERYGGWKERSVDYAHDWELVSRWMAGGEPWACTGRPTVAYGTGENGQAGFLAGLAEVRRQRSDERTASDARRRELEARAIDPTIAALARWQAREELLPMVPTIAETCAGVRVGAAALPPARLPANGEQGKDVPAQGPPFLWRDQWWCVATAHEGAGDGFAATWLLRLDSHPGIAAEYPMRGFADALPHASWMPLVDERLRFVCSLGPTIVVDASAGDGTCVVESGADPGIAIDHWRGDTPLVPWERGHLALVHESAEASGETRRAHRLVAFDARIDPIAASDAFCFRTPVGERLTGLAWSDDGRRLVATVGGSAPFIVSMPVASVHEMLRTLPADVRRPPIE
ncbi:MAG: glycosyltransferase [Betaproteobacteria bacterium]